MKNSKYLIWAAACSLCITASSCSDDITYHEPDTEPCELTVSPDLKEVGATYALISMDLSKIAGESTRFIDAGYCYSLSENPNIHNSSVSVKDAIFSEKTVTVAGLRPSQKYYLRLFASEYGGKTIYSEPIEIETKEGTPDEQLANYRGPQYPDDYGSISGWDQHDKWNLANVHDPSVMKADDGYYYMYQTDASYGNAASVDGHFACRRSKDLVNWEYLGGTMETLPSWIIPKLNEIRGDMGLPPANPKAEDFGYWAPVAKNLGNGKYRMYYSIVVPGLLNGENSWGERAFIGMMETDNPADHKSWQDKGYVITNSSDHGLNFNISPTDFGNCYYRFNAIDPSYVITPEGDHWLIYGSWHSGIAALQVNPETGMPLKQLGKPWGDNASEIAGYGKLIYSRQFNNRWQGSEGPDVIYRDGYYYLFLAYDGLDVPYNTRVVRSRNIDGPYMGIDGTDCTNVGGEAFPVMTHPYKFAGDHGWVGISHCTVFDDGDGNWYYASQGRFPAGYNGNEFSNALMLGHVRSIRWTEDGWPLVMPERYGAVPRVPVTEEEIPGVWENIDLSYVYGVQKESQPLILLSDHTVDTGIWAGKSWSFDEARQILDINGIKLYLQRECDWESIDRHATLVYTGISGNTTFWGKKNI